MKTIYEKYAGVLVNYSLELKKGDKLIITSTYLAEPLVKEVYKKAIEAGSNPEVLIGINEIGKFLLEKGSDEQIEFVSPMMKYAIENYDAFLSISAPFNKKSMENVDPAKLQKASLSSAELMKIFSKRSTSGELKWNGCEFPTNASAQECGMSISDYEDFVLNSCFMFEEDPVKKWEEMHNNQKKIVSYLDKVDIVKFVGKDIDISFKAKGRKWINSDGKFNMPDGEVFTSPLEDSVNGKVRFTYPGIYMGKEIEDIVLEVKNGEVIKWEAKKGKELLDSLFEIPGTRRFGEAAIGTNYNIKKFTKNMLFDEKIGGTIHMAIGNSIGETGGKNESPIHWDLLADMNEDSEIIADGEVIYRNGKFLI